MPTAIATPRTIIHLDLDAFYAAVEVLDNPSLKGKPLIVGGLSNRSVVSTASYEARKFGVHSAMPMVEARRRCPMAVVVSPRHERYAEFSHQVFSIFQRFTPLVEGLSLDEAFLDVTQSHALFGDGATIATQIKACVHRETGLTISAGVATNKFIAKIASDLRKPDGLVIVPAGTEAQFLAPLALERMWGVGPVAAQKLKALGYRTIGDLAGTTPQRLAQLLGSWGVAVQALANGLDERPVEPDVAAKSIGGEETYEHDLTAEPDLLRALLAQTERVARRLVNEGVEGYTITVKLKYADFTLKTRRKKLDLPVADLDSIFAVAKSLLPTFAWQGQRVRLVGIAVSDLQEGPVQAQLFPDPQQEKRKKLQQLVNAVDSRFGEGGLTRATLIEPTPPPRTPGPTSKR